MKTEITGRHAPEAEPAAEFEILPLDLPAGLVELPEEVKPPLLRWRVSLPWAGREEVEAVDEAGAVAAFNAKCGVVDTAHRHSVELLGG